MPQSTQEINIYQEKEIDLRTLINTVVAGKFLIAVLTGFVTVLALLYTLTITPTYLVSSSFIAASESSIATINKMELTAETNESVLIKFLNQLSSRDLQLKVFVDGNYVTALNSESGQIDDIRTYASSFLSSLLLGPAETITKDNKVINSLIENSYLVSITGKNKEVLSRYLNELIASANNQTINDLISANKLKVSFRLEEIFIERRLLLEEAEKNRFSEIKRLKEEDAEKIRLINDQIDRARYKEKVNRLNQIEVFIDSVKLAKSLGIVENNFKLINADEENYDLTIAIGERKNLPEWYLYGEKALIQKVELLKSRTSDDPYIPELVTLNNMLDEVQNNNILITLEARQDDSPFVEEIIALDIEKKILESRIVNISNMSDVNSIQIRHNAFSEPLTSDKRMIVLLAFFVSLVMSIFLVLIMDALKPDEKTLLK